MQDIDFSKLTLHELKEISSKLIEEQTKHITDELNILLSQKEQLEINIEKRSHELQEAKYAIFDKLEAQIDSNDTQTLAKLYQAKLQSVDLYELLSETVESAIINALEKSKDAHSAIIIEEIIKDLTFETIKEGTLNTIRVRKILSTILNSATQIAEASPNFQELILESTLKGMRSGLMQSIDRFKERLAFVPLEAKHIIIKDYDTIMQDLNQTDILFSQVVHNEANKSDVSIKKSLYELNDKMHYDLEELMHLSKETASVMKNRFSSLAKSATKKADDAMKSNIAKEAKKIGTQAIGAAKVALANALKSARDALGDK